MFRAYLAKPLLAAFIGFLPVLAVDSAAAPASAPTIGFLDAGKQHCWIRQYDAKHMKEHPKQKVTGIAVSYSPMSQYPGEAPAPMWETIDGQTYFSAKLAVTLTGEPRTAFGDIRCQGGKSKTQLACFLDGDAGSFTFSDGGTDKVQIDMPKSLGLYFANPPGAADGPPDDGVMIEAKDDQSTFILAAAKGGLCDAE